MSALRVIAIDGPAASGKSTTAGAVARRLGLPHVDSGAWYRAITWLASRDDLHDPGAIVQRAAAAPLALEPVNGALMLLAGGHDIERELRSVAVTARVSAVSAMPAVRDWVNARLRETIGELGGAVVDGRDIGTVMFPGAPLKVFLVASPASRARRRLLQRGHATDAEELARETARLEERDRLDAARPIAPLRPAPDAVEIDTTRLTFAEQVDRIVALAAERGLLVP